VKTGAEKYQEIARGLSSKEIQRAYSCARTLGLEFEQVS
jgi:uncharacterized Fe-S radical SAM superfamily protein PflX